MTHRIRVPHPLSADIKSGLRMQGAELVSADLRRRFDYQSCLGHVQPGDLGKRVWLRSYGVVMENNAQRDARKGV